MIFLTHTHDDHVADLPKARRETGAEVWASEREPAALPRRQGLQGERPFPHRGDRDQDALHLGALAGPDDVLRDRPELPPRDRGRLPLRLLDGGQPTHYADQYKNDVEKILRLPRNTVLACGHGPLTTVAQEKRHNPFFAS
jgi:hydroxyacylglutathione hydrolase